MRITLFHTGFAVYTMGLANALSKLATVTVVHPESLSKTCSELAEPEVTLVAFKKPPYRRQLGNLSAMSKAFDLIAQSKPDVVHVQETFDYAYDVHSAFKRLPNLVTTIHDIAPHPGDGDAAPGLKYSKAFGIWKSKRLIVHTDRMRHQLAARFRVSIESIDVIPHGELGSSYLHLAKLGRKKPAVREPHTLLFFGRIWAYKGLRYLIEAMPIIQAKVPDVRLLIFGRGKDLDLHMPTIAQMNNVEVRSGYLPDDEVAAAFERSGVVVLPYVEASQSGVSALAFTTGPVIVATRVGGLAEQIVDDVTGVLVDPKDSAGLALSLIALLSDGDRLERIRNNAYDYGATTISWPRLAQQTLQSYEAAMAQDT